MDALYFNNDIMRRTDAREIAAALHRHDEPSDVALPFAAAGSASVTDRTLCDFDMLPMFSGLADTVLFCDNRLELLLCCSRRLDALPLSPALLLLSPLLLLLPPLLPLSPPPLLHRLSGARSSSCGKRHRYMPPSTLVLTTSRPSGLIFTLVTVPACPTPTCVGSPSLYSHTFTVWSELPVTMYLPGTKRRDVLGANRTVGRSGRVPRVGRKRRRKARKRTVQTAGRRVERVER